MWWFRPLKEQFTGLVTRPIAPPKMNGLELLTQLREIRVISSSMKEMCIFGDIGSFVRNFHIGFDPDYECH